VSEEELENTRRVARQEMDADILHVALIVLRIPRARLPI